MSVHINKTAVMKPIDSVKPHQGSHNTEGTIDMLVRSIKMFGITQPISIDKDNVVVTGNAVYKAAKIVGLTEIPCVVVDYLSDEEIKKYRIADNKTGEFAIWNEKKLKKELSYLQDVNEIQPFFDEDLTRMIGFDNTITPTVSNTQDFLAPKIEETKAPTEKEIEKAKKAEEDFRQTLKTTESSITPKSQEYYEFVCSKCGRTIRFKR